MITPFDVVFDVSAILLLALVAIPLLRRRSAALRHCVLATALLCAAAAPMAEMLLPAWRTPMPLTIASLPASWTDAAILPPAATAASVRSSERAGPDGEAFPASAPLPTRLIVWIWLSGVAISLGFLVIGLLRLWHFTRQARPLARSAWTDIVDELRGALGIRGPVAVLQGRHPHLLLVWGWRRPTLMVPPAAAQWSEERMRSVVRHELAHLRRGDWITQLAAEVIRSLYWFNPLVWMACARLHRECEQACDDEVLAAGIGGPLYANHLLDIARDLRQGAVWVPAPAIARASTLERRIKAMLERNIDRRPLSRRARNVSLAALFSASAAIATIAAAQQFSSITGTIVDPTNGLLPDVTLVLTNDATNAKYEIRTDRNGRYEFVGLPAGTYSLETKLPGFATFKGSVTVVGKNVQQDLTLSVGTLQETITITGGQPKPLSPEEQQRIETEKVEVRQKIEAIKIKRAASRCPSAAGSGNAGPAIGGNIRTPVKYVDVRPRYPENLRGVEGDVVLSAIIGLDGHVEHVEVVSATHQEFADSTADAVRGWVFDATLLNCTPIQTAMKVTAHYRWQ